MSFIGKEEIGVKQAGPTSLMGNGVVREKNTKKTNEGKIKKERKGTNERQGNRQGGESHYSRKKPLAEDILD